MPGSGGAAPPRHRRVGSALGAVGAGLAVMSAASERRSLLRGGAVGSVAVGLRAEAAAWEGRRRVALESRERRWLPADMLQGRVQRAGRAPLSRGAASVADSTGEPHRQPRGAMQRRSLSPWSLSQPPSAQPSPGLCPWHELTPPRPRPAAWARHARSGARAPAPGSGGLHPAVRGGCCGQCARAASSGRGSWSA